MVVLQDLDHELYIVQLPGPRKLVQRFQKLIFRLGKHGCNHPPPR